LAESLPSRFLTAQAPALDAAAALGPVADLACGRGRNALAVAARGHPVVGVDRSREHLEALTRAAAARGLAVHGLRADLEAGHGIPLAAASCGVILVFRFLFRPLVPAIVETLRPGGLLLYETFTTGQPDLGWGPRRPDFLLRPGELPRLFADLEVLETWEGISEGPRPEAVARLAARRR
jgi:tellurite methyltransferase